MFCGLFGNGMGFSWWEERASRNICNLSRARAPHALAGWVILQYAPLLRFLLFRVLGGVSFFLFLFSPLLSFSNWIHAGRQRLGPDAGMVPEGWVGPSEEWPNISGNAAKTLGGNPPPRPQPDLRAPEVYLDFFTRTLDFAIRN